MGGIFISYRRDDSRGSAGRLYDDLADRFGKEVVFRDRDAILPGAEYAEVIDAAVASCDALIAVIGREWSDARDATGGRRLENANDLVRIEIAAALKRDKLVLPVLVEDASMPSPAELPADLAALAGRNALAISDDRWDYDVGRLVDRLEGVIRTKARQARRVTPETSPQAGGRGAPPGRRLPVLALGAVGLIAVVVVGLVLVRSGGDENGSANGDSREAGTDEPSTPTADPNVRAPSSATEGGAFAIGLGHVVGPDEPPGAGRIAIAGAVQRYNFAGNTGQILYPITLNPPGCCKLYWDLYDPSGERITHRFVTQDLGRVVLRVSGTYRIEVYGEGSGTGEYRFALGAVTPEGTFAIALGDTVGPDQPRGAGRITGPSTVQRYTFAGAAGQVILPRTVQPGSSRLLWSLFDPSGQQLSRRYTSQDLGRITLPANGAYSIEVYGDLGAMGTYSFVLTPQ